CGGGPVRAQAGDLAIAVDPLPPAGPGGVPDPAAPPAEASAEPGTGRAEPGPPPPRVGSRVRVVAPRVRADLAVTVPAGHECLGVVVPWSDRLFQYTVKDVALPVSGRLWLDGREIAVDGAKSW